ncbi:multifunctional oxoglutarate decarboxylase/oxoglutarate dehydrogenase thiamine pyrophosphate-binding subunit/dihydrolipoyllysine-residue succinyltransferase subunit [Pseudoclavibacter chungangensis]|uniref:Multifunctional oxoglutarate decarboxylase/oxoglutarate dehydrogenase thiamine pyrophosphate-binding subunit/dihydrolipoyllysine-residue succinyltransferase subunit n=1 Tax=Pseudoclavibacter chungangensis TaxID=587635 RepID=A0A7J5BPL5_9MICO|nr:multifunctional oxoglutarate decarboxylase/oxoglutarate dehydrogenase thiamine pyrophosphate-binding subunit/dihydrolipoyllysine-residue succinyltransferase subunit [Pseudoclavibacter chungangensis]KAB1655064.1 multifunctional oxoglutarate decarboxylase/oxoglutarate dehydrogenase thiamine pyrophosphate-binding subunit/dihydrolipoyllysine-residue succinyltransferase subunit [Pseudoclavibacter chungangensis]NYJ66173.1 2-oxoglutarate dehydrogenase E1 component [Pseudoclavibacter chungangensis]
MSNNTTGAADSGNHSDFGANDWLVEEMYEKFSQDRASVDEAWWPTLEQYGKQLAANESGTTRATTPTSDATTKPANGGATTPAGASAAKAAGTAAADAAKGPAQPAKSVQSKTTAEAPKPKPIPADAPAAPKAKAPARADEVVPLRGPAKAIAKNMDLSLEVPTATSYREIPAKLMIDNRIVINNHLRRTRGGKVSFTHLIGWALVRALSKFPSQNVYYDIVDGKPSAVQPAHINLGIAIDVPKPDGTRLLVVPSIKQAEELDFSEYLAAYEDLIKRGRSNKLTAEDYAGATISLTNPGGIGTLMSVPRLVKGQGAIIGAGALDYPAPFQGMSQESVNEMAVSKRLTLSSTYDHRVIQGAGSGEFLKLVAEHLTGGHDFYEEIFAALRIPYKPVVWSQDIHVDLAAHLNKTARVHQLINMYRVRGHMMADIDPLEYVQRTHPDLEIESHGLTFWDLEREFVAAGFGGNKRMMKLRDILGILRDSYCRTIGIEYMHLPDPEQREWFQDQLEHPYQKPTHEEQMRILNKLNEAEAFETFLQTKYVGQKRFSLEGSESVISLLDTIIQGAAEEELDEVAIGMAHRGRLNVLTNIAGKTYGQIFREFEGVGAASAKRGSGDVKYHLGIEGEFTAASGATIPVYLAANPSHLEAVNGVLEGIVRGKLDRTDDGRDAVLPILIHGDAAMSGQGIVYEVMQMSELRAYKTGGTIHVNINNQVGFTTTPRDGRSSMYSTDVAKAIQAPILHVNGDDPEAVAHVAELAFAYRQRFHSDIVIDLISYRRRGHNEGDDPSMTQPIMYNLIEAKRSVRKLYSEALVGRGDITQEEFDQAQRDFHDRLERAFAETHQAQTESTPITAAELGGVGSRESDEQIAPRPSAVPQSVLSTIGEAHANPPEGFTVHSKLKAVLQKRAEMSRSGNVDWAYAELLALGSLLMEGTPVRFTGQDSRRGTFTQRNAVFHDRANGQLWIPLSNLSDDQARLSIYDSFLSEYAVLGFEYGYSVERPDSLVLWEAQFGDFANGAQTIIDEFISSSEQKWNQRSSVVLLLPHGYEGQGPDHSSARIERFLSLAAENNMTVSQPSTPASYFHLLREQAYARPRKPLIVFTPKSMLRLRSAVSPLDEFTNGTFEPVIDDARSLDRAAVKRVVLLSGKLSYELAAELEKRQDTSIALVRVERYYPVPVEEINAVLREYPNAEIVWAQDEPENQGAWPFIRSHLAPYLENRTISVASRPEASAPSVGNMKAHTRQQADLIGRVLGS